MYLCCNNDFEGVNNCTYIQLYKAFPIYGVSRSIIMPGCKDMDSAYGLGLSDGITRPAMSTGCTDDR